MFSSRLSIDLAPNRLARALAAARARDRSLIDLTESNPTRVGIDYPRDLLAPLSDVGALTYRPEPFGSPGARSAVAREYERAGVSVDPSRVVLTASTSEAYSLIFKLLCDPGDEVLVPRPSYPLFEHLTRLDCVTPRPYALDFHGVWTIDVATVEEAMTPRTRAILLVNPNNPTGSFVKPSELERIAGVCSVRNCAIVSDEVFGDYELQPGTSSTGRLLRRHDVLAFCLGGLSKSIGLPQAKLGWMVLAGSDDRVEGARGRLELICDTYLSVGTPVQLAAETLLERGTAVRRQIQDRVRANDRAIRDRVASVPECRVLPAEGGWSAVLEVPSLGTEEDLVIDVLEKHNVLVHPGYFFDFPRESFLVVSLLPAADELGEGISRILRHVVERHSVSRG